jgi:ketosteroid isomerase-like protein
VSEANIDVLRRAVAAYNARDIEAFVEHFDPAVELHSAFSTVGGADYHGYEGLQEFFGDFGQAWGDDLHVEPEGYFDLGDQVISSYVVHGRRPETGVDVELPSALIASFRDGRIVRLKAYAHREDVFADLEVSEDDLERIAP